MTVGVSLSLTLEAGLHIQGGPVVLRLGFVAAWGRTEVFVSHGLAWDINRQKAWRHVAPWTLKYASRMRWPYGLRLESVSRAPYGDLRLHRRNLVLPSGDRPLLRGQHRLTYGELAACRSTMCLPWWLTNAVAVRHGLAYDVADINPVARRFSASWSLLAGQQLQAVMNTPELVWNGRRIRILQATLSCDEDSPVWIASVEVAELADFAGISIGDSLTLVLGLETFELVVDGKTLSRESQTSQRCEVTAISPLALLDAPFAAPIRYYRPEAVSARGAVENLVGPVDWQVPDWIIPAGRLLMDGVTPLAAVRSIVAAIGGIVESAPDGSVILRRRHPVSIPDYGQATVAQQFFDADVLSSRARIASDRGYNRVTLANEESAGGNTGDRIEYAADPDDANQGTVRAYLSPSRPVLLTHTGHPDTVITALGAVTRAETEVVEFIEGLSSTRYPVTAITAAEWRHADLGSVTADGQALVSTVPGYSLLDLTYTTTSLNWRVALAADEEVQFVLVDL